VYFDVGGAALEDRRTKEESTSALLNDGHHKKSVIDWLRFVVGSRTEYAQEISA